MGGILWVPYLIQCQVGGDDQRLLAAVASASRADVYTTSASASNVSVYTNTICVAKCLLGDTQTRELHPVDAGCAIASLDRIEPITLKNGLFR